MTSVDGPFAADTVSYGYDTLNRRAAMQINGASQTSYGYDALSRLQSITSAAGAFSYGYVGNTGMLQSLSLPNGTQTSYGYDGLERLTQMQTVAGAANISNYAYAYDNVTHRPGRTSEVSQIAAESPLTRAYGYDGVDQLTGETVSQNGQTVSQSTLAYDPMGNRTQAQSTSATSQSTTSYTSNKLNQLIALSTTTGTDTSQSTLGYDLSGNLTSVSSGTSGTSYSYDDANRLSAVEVAGQSKSTFLYDGLSRLRVSRDFAWQGGTWVQTGEVRRVYDGMNVVQERDAAGAVTCTYTRSGNIGGILARTDGNGSFYYHYDGRGNVSQLTDAQAQVQARYSYDAWGNTSASGAASALNRYRFSTKEQIGGLYSYGYRFYAPGLGRWINRDPIAERGGLNLYGFVINSPVNLTDAHGLDGGFLLVCGIIIVGGVLLSGCSREPSPPGPISPGPGAGPTPEPSPTPYPGSSGLSQPEQSWWKKKLLEKVEEKACEKQPDACKTADAADCFATCQDRAAREDWPDIKTEQCENECRANAGKNLRDTIVQK